MKKNLLEWAVFAVSLAIVATVLLTLIVYSSQEKQPVPVISVELAPSFKQGNEWIVPITVLNKGDETAEGVKVEVTLEATTGEPEKAEADFLFLPKRSHREGFVVFTSDPAEAKSLKGRAVAYEKP